MSIQISVKDWNIEAITGYKPISTFYTDFSIAEKDGIDGIKSTFQKNFEDWKSDYKYLTELVMALNWKIFEHYEKNEEFAVLYNSLWEFADGWAIDNLQGEELDYFYETTD